MVMNQTVGRILLKDDRVDVNAKCDDGATALMEASRYGREAIVPMLPEAGRVNVNAKDIQGRTALMEASYCAQEVVHILLKDSMVDIKDSNGIAALIAASENGYEASSCPHDTGGRQGGC